MDEHIPFPSEFFCSHHFNLHFPAFIFSRRRKRIVNSECHIFLERAAKSVRFCPSGLTCLFVVIIRPATLLINVLCPLAGGRCFHIKTKTRYGQRRLIFILLMLFPFPASSAHSAAHLLFQVRGRLLSAWVHKSLQGRFAVLEEDFPHRKQ